MIPLTSWCPYCFGLTVTIFRSSNIIYWLSWSNQPSLVIDWIIAYCTLLLSCPLKASCKYSKSFVKLIINIDYFFASLPYNKEMLSHLGKISIYHQTEPSNNIESIVESIRVKLDLIIHLTTWGVPPYGSGSVTALSSSLGLASVSGPGAHPLMHIGREHGCRWSYFFVLSDICDCL